MGRWDIRLDAGGSQGPELTVPERIDTTGVAIAAGSSGNRRDRGRRAGSGMAPRATAAIETQRHRPYDERGQRPASFGASSQPRVETAAPLATATAVRSMAGRPPIAAAPAAPGAALLKIRYTSPRRAPMTPSALTAIVSGALTRRARAPAGSGDNRRSVAGDRPPSCAAPIQVARHRSRTPTAPTSACKPAAALDQLHHLRRERLFACALANPLSRRQRLHPRGWARARRVEVVTPSRPPALKSKQGGERHARR
jgi:hypothetical protein